MLYGAIENTALYTLDTSIIPATSFDSQMCRGEEYDPFHEPLFSI